MTRDEPVIDPVQAQHGGPRCLVHAIDLLAAHLGHPKEQVDALIADGWTIGEAHRIAALAPSALSRPVGDDMGRIQWPGIIRVACGDRRDAEFALSDQPEFAMLIAATREHRSKGFFVHAHYRAIAEQSQELHDLSATLDTGISVDDVQYLPVRLDYAPFADHLLRPPGLRARLRRMVARLRTVTRSAWGQRPDAVTSRAGHPDGPVHLPRSPRW